MGGNGNSARYRPRGNPLRCVSSGKSKYDLNFEFSNLKFDFKFCEAPQKGEGGWERKIERVQIEFAVSVGVIQQAGVAAR